MTESPPLRWDVFCRVVDNHGDLGVCWRLARRLAALGESVRLWVDDSRALAWMAPGAVSGAVSGSVPGIEVQPWRSLRADEQPGDVVLETFGGDLPEGWLERMAQARPAPVWIDLEYLSAETYVERSHRLPSPQMHGPGAGLTRWFFYPGFTPRTGGLLLEDDLETRQSAFDATAWLASLGIHRAASPAPQRTISLFCYEQPALAAWLAHWQAEPTRLLVTPGHAARQVAATLGCGTEPGTSVQRGALTAHFLPWLPQTDYDHLLWACDLNHVRGEESLVRAIWSGRPFVWQAYRQDDDAHRAKVQAFVDIYAEGADDRLSQALHRRFAHWNEPHPPAGVVDQPDLDAWGRHARTRTQALCADARTRGDLGWQLYRFARGPR